MFKCLAGCIPPRAVEEADEFVSVKSREVDVIMDRKARKQIVHGGQPLMMIGKSWLCQKLNLVGMEVVGEGAFGQVYRAKDANDKEFAVKAQTAPSDAVDDLCKTYYAWCSEVSILQEVRGHPNFVQFEKVIYLKHCSVQQKVPSHMAIMMEYLPLSVGKIMELRPEVYEGEEQLRAFLIDMMEGLYFLHSKEIIHHDIKPWNCMAMVSFEPSALHTESLDTLKDQMKLAKYKIIDFGLAEKLSPSLNGSAGNQGGTRVYMPPERCKTPRICHNGYLSDGYSLGITAVELASPWSFDRFVMHGLDDMEGILRDAVTFLMLDHIKGTTLLEVILGLVKKDHTRRMSIVQALDLLRKSMEPASDAGSFDSYDI